MNRTTRSEDANDAELLSRAAEGDRLAFGLLVRRYQGMVIRFATRLLNEDRSTAEDIGQEAFLRLYRSSPTRTVQGTIRAYLLTITRNLCRDYQRRQRETAPLAVLADHVAPELTGEETMLRAERALAVRQAIAALPEEQRTVLILAHYEGLPYHEIAEVVGCPPGTVASRKHHAIASLRRSLGAYLEESK